MPYLSYLAMAIRLITIVFAAPLSPITFRGEFFDGLRNSTWPYKIQETNPPPLL